MDDDQSPIAAGDFGQWREQFVRSMRDGAENDVPCGTCTACCRSSQFVHVGPAETEALAHIPEELLFKAPGREDGTMVLGFDEKGRCPMLGESGCTIYEYRPQTCRTYDCRIFPATGLSNDERPAIAERARRWQFDYSGDSRSAHAALRERAAELKGRESNASKSDTELALAAMAD